MNPNILHNIAQIHRSSLTIRARNPLVDDISPVQYTYLNHALLHPGVNQDDYARALCVDKTTVAHQLAKLEKAGYLVRTTDPVDMRCRRITPSEKTQTLAPKIQAVNRLISETALAGFTEEEMEVLERLTTRMYENMTKLTDTEVEE